MSVPSKFPTPSGQITGADWNQFIDYTSGSLASLGTRVGIGGSGSGVSGSYAKWISTGGISPSLLSEIGSNATLSGSLVATGNITANTFYGVFSGSILDTGSIIIPSGSTLTLQSGSIIPFALPASYVVFSGSIVGVTGPYYAINGSTNNIDYSGANAKTIIQNVINIISGSGGLISIKEGTYNINGEITIKDANNITIRGVYNKSILLQTQAAGVALNIGNQSATDSNYHAQNIVIEDLVLDGGYPTITNGAGLGVSTAKNIIINRCVFQNSGEIATGGFRITNWNTTQALSNNIWVTNCYFNQQKIAVTGLINGWMTNNVFEGQAPGVSGTKALVDYSKGDITPSDSNKLSYFHFENNHITGWTRQIFLGFQSVNNCTIMNNYISGSNVCFGGTVQPGDTVFDLNGLKIENNIFDGCSGGMTFKYGNKISIKGNRWLTDIAPANFTSALTVTTGSFGSNPIPSLIEIEGNIIYKWGGVGMDVGFSTGSIKNNKIIDMNQFGGSAINDAGILIRATLNNVDINENEIISTQASGTGSSIPIHYSGVATNISIMNNRLKYAAGGNVIFQAVPFDSTVVIGGNSV